MRLIRHILVATDLTDRSERALGRAIGLVDGCAVTLLHVLAGGLPAELENSLRASIEASLTVQVRRSEVQPGTGAIGALVLSGDPSEVIVREGVARRSDLLVVGEPQKHRRQDLFVGTTAERVIRCTDRPVLVVKRAGHGRYGRVLVAFDGSEAAVRATETALAMNPDAEFRITHSWLPPRPLLGTTETKRQGIRDENERTKAQIEQAVGKAVTGSTPRPVRLTIEMIENNPYVAISNESGWAELLVIGTHSKGNLATSTRIGSLARHMLAEVPCDVLVSPP